MYINSLEEEKNLLILIPYLFELDRCHHCKRQIAVHYCHLAEAQKLVHPRMIEQWLKPMTMGCL